MSPNDISKKTNSKFKVNFDEGPSKFSQRITIKIINY